MRVHCLTEKGGVPDGGQTPAKLCYNTYVPSIYYLCEALIYP